MSGASGQVVIIGGGISGLSAAYELGKAGVPYTLIEKQARLGGVIETCTRDGFVLEGGPDSFISQKPEALALIKELGLGDQVIGSNDHQRTTYILRRGKLVKLPEGMMMIVPSRAWPMVKSPLLGWGTKARMAVEMLRRPSGPQPDRPVADFVIDHFGKETLDYLAEPLLAGVYGGDPREMSVASVLPRFAEMEAKHGSLGRAVIKSRAPASSGPLFRTLKGGLAALVAKLAEKVTVRHAEAQSVERHNGGFRVRVDGGWMEAQQVILAGPAWAAAQLTAALDPELAALLSQIPYTSSLTVSLAYEDREFDGMRAGFGFLAPKKERRRLLACTFMGTKFPNRVPEGWVLLRCFFGGAGDEVVLEESDESLVAMAREELRRILNLTAAPAFTSISRWPRSMAQYTVGHGERWRQIQARVAAIPGLHIAGNGYTGIGIPDCIRMGRHAAQSLLKPH